MAIVLRGLQCNTCPFLVLLLGSASERTSERRAAAKGSGAAPFIFSPRRRRPCTTPPLLSLIPGRNHEHLLQSSLFINAFNTTTPAIIKNHHRPSPILVITIINRESRYGSLASYVVASLLPASGTVVVSVRERYSMRYSMRQTNNRRVLVAMESSKANHYPSYSSFCCTGYPIFS